MGNKIRYIPCKKCGEPTILKRGDKCIECGIVNDGEELTRMEQLWANQGKEINKNLAEIIDTEIIKIIR